VPNPDAETRREILQIHGAQKPLNVSVEYMMRITDGFSGAQIENFLNEAVLFALRNGSLPISPQLLDHIKEKVLLGHTSSVPRPLGSPGTLRRIAIHEVGHLVTALHSRHYERPWKITIESMNPKQSLGYTIFETPAQGHDGLFLREYLEDQLKVLLGGRAAEQVFFGNSTSSGAMSDLTTAFTLAKKMVLEYGMGQDMIYPHFSESYKERIDEQIRQFLQEAYQLTLDNLEAHRELVDAFATELLHHKTMDSAQIREYYERVAHLNRHTTIGKQYG